MAGIAYHPWFAAHGTKDFSDGKKWYETSIKVTSLYDCVVNAGTGNGRPDSKTAEHCYINGQGGLICYAIPNAKTPTYKHQEEVRRNLVDGYIENGVEYTQYHQHPVITGTSYSWDSAGNRFYISAEGFVDEDAVGLGKNYHFNLGRYFLITGSNGKFGVFKNINNAPYGSEYIHFPHSNGNLYIGECVYSSEGSFGNDVNTMLQLFPKGTTLTLHLMRKSPYLATQGTTTHTDIIGDPAPYNSNDASVLPNDDTSKADVLCIANDGNTDSNVTDMPTGTLVWDANTSTMWKTKVDTIDLSKSTPSVAIEEGDNWTQVKKGYPQELRNLLASGKGVGFMNPLLIGQDGEAYLSNDSMARPVFSKKYIRGYTYPYLTLSDGKYRTENQLNNTVSNDRNNYYFANFIVFTHYQAQNQPAVPISVTKPIQTIDRNLIASDHHSVDAYNGLIYAASSKVATGSSVEARDVEDVLQDVSKNIFTTPKHSPLILDNQSIVASKALLTQTANATQIFTQEMVYDSSAGDFGDDNQFDQLTNGIVTDLNGHTVQTKVLLKPSSIYLGE